MEFDKTRCPACGKFATTLTQNSAKVPEGGGE